MSAAPRDLAVKVTNFRRNESRTRQGYCSLLFPNLGLTIRAIEVHRFDSLHGARQLWMQYPGRPYNRDGVQLTFQVIFFTRAVHEQIQDAVLAQLQTVAPEIFAAPTSERAA